MNIDIDHASSKPQSGACTLTTQHHSEQKSARNIINTLSNILMTSLENPGYVSFEHNGLNISVPLFFPENSPTKPPHLQNNHPGTRWRAWTSLGDQIHRYTKKFSHRGRFLNATLKLAPAKFRAGTELMSVCPSASGSCAAKTAQIPVFSECKH